MLFFFGTSAAGGAGGGIKKVADAAARTALSPAIGDFVIQLDTNDLYYFNSSSAWELYVEDLDNDDIAQVISDLAAHIADTTAAHAASAIGFTPAGTIAATNVQTAISEVATEAAADLAAHIAAGDPHTQYALDTDLTAAVAAEASARATADSNEASTRATAVSNEATTRAAADTALDGRVTTLEGATHAAATITAFGSVPDAKGASISGQAITMQPADDTHPGLLSVAAQAIGGEKRFAAGVNVGATSALGASEIFKVNSTTQGSRPLPSMTTAQRTAIASPATGLMVYDTDNKGAMFYDGTQWQFMDGRATIAAAQTPANAATLAPLGYRSQILPLSGSGGAAIALADISVANAKDGDVLILMGTDNTATVTIVSATNTVTNGSCTLGQDNSLTLQFYSSKWREVGRNA
jgi:hypothetical protein